MTDDQEREFLEFCRLDELVRRYYGTHRRALFRAMLETRGDRRPVLELGTGETSTQLLHDLCAADGRVLYSVEHDPEYHAKIAELASDAHVVSAEEPKNFPIESLQWSVALIDHKPSADRYRELDRLKGRCAIIVIHDIGSCCWPMASLKNMFRYAVDDRERPGFPPTGAVSDEIDVSGWTFPEPVLGA